MFGGSSGAVKVVVVGDKSVGKSALIKSFIKLNKNNASSVKDVKKGKKKKNKKHITKVTIKHKTFELKFIEKAGWEPQEEPKQAQQQPGNPLSLYKENTNNEANAQVIVYDVSNEESFNFISKWVYGNRTQAPTILIANKCDIFPNNIDGKEEILSYGYCRNHAKSGPNYIDVIMELCFKYYGKKKSGKEYAKQNNMEYFEVSIKNKNDGGILKDAFECISELALTKYELSDYSAQYAMLRERCGSFRPTIWKPGYGKLVGEPPKDEFNGFNHKAYFKAQQQQQQIHFDGNIEDILENMRQEYEQQQQQQNSSWNPSGFMK